MTGRSEVGRRLDELYPALPRAAHDRRSTGQLDARARRGRARRRVVAYPHAAAAPTVGALRERGVRVVDLSADFRLSATRDLRAVVRRASRARTCSREAVYGLTELHREQIADARASSPTPAATRPRPCSRSPRSPAPGLIADVVIDAKQGISGAGRTFDDTTHLSMAGENILPYKVAGHRHTPEIEEQLDGLLRAPGHARPVPGAPGAARPGRARQLLRDAHPHRRARAELRRALRATPTPTSRSSRSSDGPPGVARGARDELLPRLRRRRPHTGKVLVFARSTTSGRAPPRRRCRTST